MRYRPRESWQARADGYLKRLKKPRLKCFYRCGKCRARKVLARELWLYVNPPRCCGGVFWTLDTHRLREWDAKAGAYAVCYCGQNSWDAPHRPGSTYMCRHSTYTMAERELAWNQGRYT